MSSCESLLDAIVMAALDWAFPKSPFSLMANPVKVMPSDGRFNTIICQVAEKHHMQR